MNSLALACILPVPFLLLMVHRISDWVLAGEPKSQRRKNAWVNLGLCVAYSLLCWLPVLTYEEAHCTDLPAIDLGPVLLIMAWALLFILHVLVYWLVVELNGYYERKAIDANTNSLPQNEQP